MFCRKYKFSTVRVWDVSLLCLGVPMAEEAARIKSCTVNHVSAAMVVEEAKILLHLLVDLLS